MLDTPILPLGASTDRPLRYPPVYAPYIARLSRTILLRDVRLGVLGEIVSQYATSEGGRDQGRAFSEGRPPQTLLLRLASLAASPFFTNPERIKTHD
ncbi:MAG: hypothetical protein LZF86_90003 [Nitrospira sp.]|nr:MAG: hypothetical protein LZF86_90003 [Nitrospira sp.]